MKKLLKSLLISLLFCAGASAQQEIPSPWVTVTPVLTVGNYTSGMAFGGVLQLSNALCTGYKTGYLTAATEADFNNQLQSIDLWFFDTAPTGTYTDHTVVTMTQADLNKSIGHVHLDSTTDVATLATNGELHKGSLAEPVRTLSGSSIFVLPIVKGNETIANANAVQFKFAFACDMKTAH